ncbi:MAG TPA: polyphosphate kinase 1, partial [Acidimicrobiales bacterium]|nr:polyphosphate kinase 1 [Acidimicrobiales bacterium]
MEADVIAAQSLAHADSAGQVQLNAGPPDLAITMSSPERFLNREISWLDFANRLVDLAEDVRIPLLERAKFIAIWSSGADEFFQVRVAGLKDQIAAGLRTQSPDGMTARAQLAAIAEKLRDQISRLDRVYLDVLVPELDKADVEICSWGQLDNDEQAALSLAFERDIFPVLTPLAVGPGHPFPYISNLSLSIGVVVEDRQGLERRFARVKVPPLLPRFVQVGDKARFVLLEELIAANLNKLFPDMAFGGYHVFRVTRNADLALEEGEADDLLAAVELELRRRRFGRAVRLDIAPDMPPDIRELLVEELELTSKDVFESRAPLDLGQLWAIHAVDRPDLHDPPWVPRTPPRLATAGDGSVDLFAVLRERDVLVHHPYDSFKTSVEAFLNQAADDPHVLAIKQALYRTSEDTAIVAALIRAAESGIQVAALVELKARFDEQANIFWARQLEQAGVHVVYGLVGLKTHSKTCLVVRREEDGLRRYCHIGTGNYNSETASVYEDLGLFTSDPLIGADLTNLFNYLTGFGRPSDYQRIVVSPHGIRAWCIDEIGRQAAAGSDGRITIKVNGLTDPEVIDALYAASQAGVRIELVVRGLCSIRAGVPGLSENITVRSIVGRFLEHSRIYRFGAPTTEPNGGSSGRREPAPDWAATTYHIGSADLMERNLERRVEVLVPVLDNELRGRLDETLELNLADDTNSWELAPDGTWRR